MRKTLRFSLLSLLLMICGVSFAQTTVTFDVAVDKSASADAGEVSITKDGVTIATTQGIFGNGLQYRIYKSQTFTATSTEGNIQKIEFTCTASGTAKYGPGCFTDPTSGTYTYEDTVGTWVGDDATVSMVASLNQVRATKIVVTIGSVDPNAVAAPVIVGNTEFDGETEVVINAGEGLNVYYTLDGTEPTASSTAYTGAFVINKTCVVSAIAMKGDKKSEVVTKQFTKIELEEVTIASLNTLTADKANLKLILNKAKVVYVDGNTLHLREGDKALMFYNSPIKMPLNAVVSGSVNVDYDNYYGIHEVKGNSMTNADNLTITESSVAAKPTVATIADIHALKYIADLVELQNVQIVADGTKYYAVSGDDKIQLYGGIAVKDYADDGKSYNVSGVFNNIYKGVAQIEPISISFCIGSVIWQYTTMFSQTTQHELRRRADSDNIYIIRGWGQGLFTTGGVDLTFTWDRTTNMLTLPENFIGMHSTYGEMFISDLAYYDGRSYADAPCYYDPAHGVAIFAVCYYVGAGFFGQAFEYVIFKLDDNIQSGIDGIEATQPNKTDAIYNIAGQRLQKLQKGLNIVGGKKIIVK